MNRCDGDGHISYMMTFFFVFVVVVGENACRQHHGEELRKRFLTDFSPPVSTPEPLGQFSPPSSVIVVGTITKRSRF